MDKEERRRFIEAAIADAMAKPHPRPYLRRPRPKFQRCVVCDEPFVASRRDALYCSDAHRQKAHRQRHRPKQMRMRL